MPGSTTPIRRRSSEFHGLNRWTLLIWVGKYEPHCDWAMARYIEAMEMEDPDERPEIMDEILKYNREDLEGTWAVL